MNQTQAAKKLGISQPHMNQVLLGKKRLSYMAAKRISRLIGCSTIEIMDAMDSNNSDKLHKLFGITTPKPTTRD